MEYKKMREYTHEEFIKLVESLSEEELLNRREVVQNLIDQLLD